MVDLFLTNIDILSLLLDIAHQIATRASIPKIILHKDNPNSDTICFSSWLPKDKPCNSLCGICTMSEDRKLLWVRKLGTLGVQTDLICSHFALPGHACSLLDSNLSLWIVKHLLKWPKYCWRGLSKLILEIADIYAKHTARVGSFDL